MTEKHSAKSVNLFNIRKLIIVFLQLIFLINVLHAETDPVLIYRDELEIIPQLESKDAIFSKYSKLVQENYKRMMAKKAPEIQFFLYKVPEKMKNPLMFIQARCNIIYDTIATLNNIESNQEDITGRWLLLPTARGIFISSKNQNKIQSLLFEKFQNQNLTNTAFYYKIISNQTENNTSDDFYFLPDMKFDSFDPTIRYYFLDSSLILPLKKDKYWVSSQFGMRKNPFSGDMKQHNGIDLAAEEGTPVFSVSDGTVTVVRKNDKVYGNYVVLLHRDRKYSSIYAHLKSIEVEEGKDISSGFGPHSATRLSFLK